MTRVKRVIRVLDALWSAARAGLDSLYDATIADPPHDDAWRARESARSEQARSEQARIDYMTKRREGRQP